MTTLTDRDRQILDLAGQFYRYDGIRDEAKRELCGTAIAFDQRLNALLNDEAALAYAPMVVKRYQRIRGRRHRAFDPYPR